MDSNDNNLEETTVIAYSQTHRVDIGTARKRLARKYKEEVENVDAKEIALKCLKSMRLALPKIQGLEGRESDVLFRLKSLENKVDRLNTENEILKDIAKKSVQTINTVLEESEYKIEQLKKNKLTLYEKICQKITSILKKLKS